MIKKLVILLAILIGFNSLVFGEASFIYNSDAKVSFKVNYVCLCYNGDDLYDPSSWSYVKKGTIDKGKTAICNKCDNGDNVIFLYSKENQSLHWYSTSRSTNLGDWLNDHSNYNRSRENTFLKGDKCISNLSISNNNNIELTSNLNESYFLDVLRNRNLNLYPALNTSHYMKTFVKAELINRSSGDVVYSINNTKSSISNDYSFGGITYKNYFLAEDPNHPIDIKFEFLNNSEIYKNYGPGEYYWKINAIPIDGKCDFTGDGELGGDEINSSIKFSNGTNYFSSQGDAIFDVFKDSDKDGWADKSNLGKGNDLCPNELGYDDYQGCKYEYSVIKSDEEISFEKTLLSNKKAIECPLFLTSANQDHISTFDGIYFSNEIVSTKPFYKPNKGSGIYSCHYNDGTTKNITLRYNVNDSNSCNISGYIVKKGDSITLYSTQFPTSKDNIVKLNCTEYSKDKTKYSDFTFSKPVVDLTKYTNLNIKINQISANLISFEISTNDHITCKINEKECANQYSKEIKFNKIPIVKIKSDNNLVDVIKIDPIETILIADKIKKFRNSSELFDFANKSNEIASNFNITKDLEYNDSTNRTRVKLSLKGVKKIDNLTIYTIIPKDEAKSLDDIKFINNGGGKLIVNDKDPVIGWYFNESSDDTDVEYEVNGDGDGGTLIITQEPIIYNGGDLIINYREGKNSCADGEVHLFDLEDLVDSRIMDKNTSNYQICIGHRNSSVNLYGDNTHGNYLNISSFRWNNNISSNFNELINKLELSTDNSNLFWNMQIQEDNPNGNYSCLGSFDKLNAPSYFGDCDYNKSNRLWLFLGEDHIAPVTKMDYSYISHNQIIHLKVSDNVGGSGFKNLTYRVVGDTSWITTTNQNQEVKLKCDNDWGCKKKIEAYSYDNAGNRESTKTFTINIVDKGSACQSSCLSKPSPDRYLKECNNINGCDFYNYDANGNYDNGDYVSKLCDLFIKDSWVKFNSTHEIKCPSGPFRPLMFSNDSLSIKHSTCMNLVKIPYPVILNGEPVVMDVLICKDSLD